MKFVNLCKHELIVIAADSSEVTVSPSGTIAMVGRTPVAETQIEVGGKTFRLRTQGNDGPITGLPAPEEGTIFLTGAQVAQKAAKELGRTDVWGPDTGPDAVRTEAGQVAKVRGLQAWTPTPPPNHEPW